MARAARELRASHLAERRALAGFLLTGSAADAAALQQARRGPSGGGPSWPPPGGWPP
jgi:hypothetical protein